ncbi:hypothetical protein NM208_g10120 [Fusarium decemcellulare]|uniref:Uncharacterized protein n=1 Tax=Fusarium decemcellulare TaxID=57161 RepID=A0ACC1RZ89_9HYPO|nr:hypothetical protein NM208_g10120 [Fusarium decemcellulare]
MESIEKFPFAVCDPRTVNFAQDHVLDRESSVWPPSEARYLRYGDQHRWFAVSRQYPFELLVRKITSSQQGINGDLSATVPMAVVNITGDDQATAEAHMMMRFAIWA